VLAPVLATMATWTFWLVSQAEVTALASTAAATPLIFARPS
jgi:hypothetical protein